MNVVALMIKKKLKFYLIDFDYCLCVDSNPACEEMQNLIEYLENI